MCAVIESQIPSAIQSWTNVAPVRIEIGNDLEPLEDHTGREHHDDRGAEERRVQLLARIELAEPSLVS